MLIMFVKNNLADNTICELGIVDADLCIVAGGRLVNHFLLIPLSLSSNAVTFQLRKFFKIHTFTAVGC